MIYINFIFIFQYRGIHVVEGPPGTEPHIIPTPPPVASVLPALESNTSTIDSFTPALVSVTNATNSFTSASKDCDLKRRIEELTCKKFELEVMYLKMKVKKNEKRGMINESISKVLRYSMYKLIEKLTILLSDQKEHKCPYM
jgi:hypothetical protein